jgi:hypothetical protein
MLALFVIGCGGSDGSRDRLSDTAWLSPIEGFDCAKGFEFDSDGTYTFAIACTLTDGTNGGYVEVGDYSIDDKQIATIAKSASCPAAQVQQVFAANYALTTTTLTLSVPSGITTYTKFTPTTPMAGTIAAGCFDSSGAFARFPLTPL